LQYKKWPNSELCCYITSTGSQNGVRGLPGREIIGV